MFSRNRSRRSASNSHVSSLFGGGLIDRKLNHRRSASSRHTKLGVEALEDRRMLAVLLGPGDDLEGLNDDNPPAGQDIGAEPTVSIENFTLNDGAGDDQDVFRYRAHSTGKLLLNLQQDGDVGFTYDVRDSTNTSLLGGPLPAGTTRTIPVVEGQQYWVVVADSMVNGAGSSYSFAMSNTAVPAPSSVSLSPASDTGASNSDGITGDNTPTFFIQADLETFLTAPANDSNIGTIDSNGATGYDVQLVATNLTTGAQTTAAATRLGTSATWTATTSALADGDYLISARTQVFDPAGNPAGFSQLSTPIFVTIDAVADPIMGTITLAPSSDSGMVNSDNVTNKDQPTFEGLGPANSTVRIFAVPTDPTTGAVTGPPIEVGIGTVGSDGTDGIAGDGIGAYQVAVNELVDGRYNISAQFETDAGLFSPFIDLAAQTFTSAPALAIPDLTTVTDTLNVAGATSPIVDDVNVVINLTHTFVGDLEITLISPSGTRVLLTDNRGGTGNDFTNTAFDDSAPDPISGIVAGDAPFTGFFTPEQPLSAFIGEMPNGNWQLEIVDNIGVDVGTLDSWSIQFSEALFVDTAAPNTPFLDLITDTGRSNADEVTMTNLPTVVMRSNATVTGGVANPFANDVKYRLYVRPDGNINAPETLVYDSFADTGDFVTLASIGRQISLTLNDPNGTPIPDGVHNFVLEIEDRAGNISHDFLLEFAIDTTVPPVQFGIPANVDGLIDDTGDGINPATADDRITSDTTPRLVGTAEANATVQVIADTNNNNILDLADQLVGQTTAIPIDGNQANPLGHWELQVVDDLNGLFNARDGLRRLFVTAEDLAGNVNPVEANDDLQRLEIFIDTQGPQVNSVTVDGNETYDLFDPKPSVDGFTPLINALNINFIDPPNRLVGDPNFEYQALADNALVAGNYVLVGDRVGIVAIASVGSSVVGNQDGFPAQQQVTLTFAEPLPDDRYTLVIRDSITDPVGNRLDGESNADEPQDDPTFPSGDGIAGGDFVARFTVDSRPEIGTYVAQNINIDTNGNFVWDPATSQIGGDATNVDISFTLPVANANGSVGLGGYNVHDLVFAGRFGQGGSLIVGDDTIFVIDVSTSTDAEFLSTNPVGDLNSDGLSNTILDAQIAAFIAFNQELVNRGLGNTAQVSLVAFSDIGDIIDVNPVAAGEQVVTTPLADLDGNGMRDIEEAARSLNFIGFTNFEGGLQQAIAVLDTAGIADGDANILFLSDGSPTAGGSFDDEAAAILARGHNLRAFGVGAGSSLGQLQIIDPDAIQFTTADELIAVFGGGGVPGGAGANGFDQLAAFGWSAELGSKRWIIDTNNDGVVTIGTDILTIQPALANFNVAAAIPVAGNFDDNFGNGDEIGLYYAGQWAFDFDRDFIIQADEVVAQGNLFGAPIVGDFDGDGTDDLAVFNDNQFFFDLNGDYFTDRTLIWGFPGVLDRPVAADMDQDGIDDIGLFVPRNSAQPNRPQAEWYFLISDDPAGTNRVTGTINQLNHAFTPVPFGNDIYAEFGDELALPIVGNFDPPVAADGAELVVDPNVVLNGDYDGSGTVDRGDYSVWKELFGTSSSMADGNGDGIVNSADYSIWRNNLGQTAMVPSGSGGGSGSLAAATSTGAVADGQLTGAEILAGAVASSEDTGLVIFQASGGGQTAPAPLPVTASGPSSDNEELLLLQAAFDILGESDELQADSLPLAEEPEAESTDSMDEFFAGLAITL